jgi:uncharacterized surface protein with fasciclin (FAS1) repeats
MNPTGKQTGAKPSTADVQSGTPAAKKGTAKKGTSYADGLPNADNLLATCESIPRLQAFSSAIGAAGLEDLLNGDGPFTIFAPTDKAFSKMPDDELALLLSDPTRAAELVRHHVVSGRVSAPRASKPRKATPEFGGELKLTATDRGYRVDKARILRTNIRASNGVIHAIDTVLDPS